jgi:hypothetical protein
MGLMEWFKTVPTAGKAAGANGMDLNRLAIMGGALRDAGASLQGREGGSLLGLIGEQNKAAQNAIDSMYKQKALDIEQQKADAEVATARIGHDTSLAASIQELLKKKGKTFDKTLQENADSFFQQGKRLGLYSEYKDSTEFKNSFLLPRVNEYKTLAEQAKQENYAKIQGFFQPIEKAFSPSSGPAQFGSTLGQMAGQSLPQMGMAGFGAGAAETARNKLSLFLKQLGM